MHQEPGERRVCLSKLFWWASCFDLQESKGLCVDVCVCVCSVWVLPAIMAYSWKAFFAHTVCNVTATPHFTNEQHNDTISKNFICETAHSVTEHWSYALCDRTSPWYLLNVGWCRPSISLVYVKFHSDLQYVRNHRNRLAFVSCARESVLWAELSNTAVADDWPTHTFGVEEKNGWKITLIKGVTFWRAEDDFLSILFCDKLSLWENTLCTSQNPEFWCFGRHANLWKPHFGKKCWFAFLPRVRWESWCHSYILYESPHKMAGWKWI